MSGQLKIRTYTQLAPTFNMSKIAKISTVTRFINEQSDKTINRYTFAYTITIENIGKKTFTLISRHWLIRDSNNKVEEVFGEGVVGEQPVIKPGKSYTYTSGAVLETEMGTMQGSYELRMEDNEKSNVVIPEFLLSIPRTLH
jgi:ApaG protein